MNNNAEKAACDFYDWLVSRGYCDGNDKVEDIKDVIKDFVCIEHQAPKLFNLLRNLSS